ncbi:hypothetical protein CLOBOL_06861 [Enterocloster bolteae ATCC BAA-613]|uniref:Uncharacterized protein n=1 Tax=Enterocloster bolteae (strain ATCC BAA-613 / DSM 15670 / CCUG 46953 / JCM 12243 / WAL 16351) TaxID=411902 RepID=A8S496_ENTBW|nr:hypothetical protein CLOBOL_06861 [Enterocloster bolteae ATCC BAA-613]
MTIARYSTKQQLQGTFRTEDFIRKKGEERTLLLIL